MVEILNLVLRTARSNIKNLAQYKKVLVVLGNETCDLDSAISSIVYSLLLHHQKAAPDVIVVPVFNIPSSHLPVKTEVNYVLKKFGVDVENTICRNEIDLMSLHNSKILELTLVDHHVLPPPDQQLASSVVTVMDHRPLDRACPWAGENFCTLSPVGSCCTLVADRLFTLATELVTPSVATMLLGTILVDTACLSEAAGRALPLDHLMADKLQKIAGDSVNRNQLFAELRAAKSDITTLTTAQLLIKDLKLAAGVPIAGLPITVKEFLSRPDAGEAVLELCRGHNASECLVYGSEIKDGDVIRDLAVFATDSSTMAQEIVAALTNSKDPDFGLVPLQCSVRGFQLFQQTNVKHTRKQMLPVVLSVAAKLNTS